MDYHDVLAAVGASTAHPGGFDSTETWMNAITWSSSLRVLEVGCGTGKTSLELVRRFGCQVTGVDVRPAMIKKARKRADLMHLTADLKVASAEHLPFEDESFDVVITESVNVFVRAERALKEYVRVLKPGGKYVDVEMLVVGPVPQSWRESTRALYGAVHVPDHAGWKKMYQEAGFSEIRVLSTRPVNPAESMQSGNMDEVDISSPGAFQNPLVISILSANAKWLESNHRSVGYGIYLCSK